MAGPRFPRRTVAELLDEARAAIFRLTPAQARQAQLAGAQLIDMRSDSARERDGTVSGSVHVPRTVFEWRLDQTSAWRNPYIGPLQDPILVICDHGYSSSLAAYLLVQLGYTRAGDVIGGIEAWREAGLPLERVVSGRPSDELPGRGPPETGLATAQQAQWERALRGSADRYGPEASAPARAALSPLREIGAEEVLELGAGQGRDALFFAASGLSVTALDFALASSEAIAARAAEAGLDRALRAIRHDLRVPLPFNDCTFDGCYSHMLFCMALSERELDALAAEVARVLRPGGLCIYTARTTDDPDYRAGTHQGENLYELNGFVVHFFDRTLVERLASGYELVDVDLFEEGLLPRRLYRVTMRKPTTA